MRAPGIALTTALLVLTVRAAHGDVALAPDAHATWVLGAGQEDVVGRMLTPSSGPWRLLRADVQQTRIIATYRRGTGADEASLVLVHPSAAPGEAPRSERFAVHLSESEAPGDLLDAVLDSLRAHESAFVWTPATPQRPGADWRPDSGRPVTLEDVPGLLSRAEGHLGTEDHEDALRLVEKVIEGGAEADWARREAGYLLRRLGHEDRARAELEASLALLDASADTPREKAQAFDFEIARARSLIGLDRQAEADAILTDLFRSARPESLCRAIGVGQDLMAIGRLADAEAFLMQIVEKSPDCAEAYGALSHAARARGGAARMVPILEEATERLPDDPGVAGALADAYKLVGRRHDAIAVLEELVARGHDQPSVISPLLGLYTRGAPPLGTFERYRSRAESDPDDHIAAFFTGVLLHYEQDYERSNAYLDRVTDRLMHEPRIGIYLGMNHFHLGNQDEAVRWIQHAVRQQHADPDVFYCRAEILMDVDPEGALEDLRRYLALTEDAPDSSPSKQAMVRRKARDLARCLGAKVPTECMRIARTLRFAGIVLPFGLVLGGALVLRGRRRGDRARAVERG